MMKRFFRNASGNVAVIFALAGIPLCLAAGAAMDSARAYRTQSVLQAAVDSATLAAGASGADTDAEVEALVIKYLAGNDAAAAVTKLTAVNTVVDGSNGTITVTVKGDVKTSLMALAGIPSMSIGATAQVNTGSQSLEIALVLDNTGSMGGTKIADLKVAATLLIDTLAAEAASYAKLRFGIVPFAQYVNVDASSNASLSVDVPGVGWTGCVGSRSAPGDEMIGVSGNYPGIVTAKCPAPITPLTSDILRLHGEISAMNADGATYIPAGVLWGWNVLDSRTPFAEAMTATQRAKAQGQRVMVVMTDGANTIYPTYPDHAYNDPDKTPNSATLTKQVNAKTAAICENVKAEGIRVFTVAFQINADQKTTAEQVTDIKAMLRGCASDPDMAFDAQNGAALKEAFLKIAKELSTLHLSR